MNRSVVTKNPKTAVKKDAFQNPAFQALIGKLIDESLELKKLYEPIQKYQEILKQEIDKKEKNADYSFNEELINNTKTNLMKLARNGNFRITSCSAQLSQTNKLAKSDTVLELESKFPKELNEFTEDFDLLARAKTTKSDEFKFLFDNLCYRLKLDKTKVNQFFILQEQQKQKNVTGNDDRKNGKNKEFEEILCKLPDKIQSSESCDSSKPKPKSLEILLEEIVLDESEKLKLKHHFEHVKKSLNNLDKILNGKNLKKIAEHISNWASNCKQNGKLKNNQQEIYDAIAIMNKANWIATGGHVLRDVQILTIMIACCLKNQQNKQKGILCQVSTGEGKTTIIAIIAAIRALSGEQVDVITSNPILALDAIQNKRVFYSLLGLNVSHNNPNEGYTFGSNPCYSADILYGSIGNFQFDYLKHEFFGSNTRNTRKFESLIIDEVDSMIIDNAGHIAKVTEPFPGMEIFRYIYIKIWQELFKAEEILTENFKNESANKNKYELYNLQAKFIDSTNGKLKEYIKESRPLDSVINLVPDHLKEYTDRNLDKWIDNAIRAKYEFHIDQQYIIKKVDNENVIIPVDFENTGVSLLNTIWSHGLHQFLQLKHNLRLTNESLTCCFISNTGFIKKYASNCIFGITGTLGSQAEQDLLSFVYNVEYAIMPTYTEKTFIEQDSCVVTDESFYMLLAIHVLKEIIDSNRAVLIICETIDDLKQIYSKIDMFRVKCSLDCKIKVYDDEDKSKITNEIVNVGDIIIATNLAGRGTDLRTSKELDSNGGLHICVSFLPYNKRVEEQAFGRTSRQGRPGTAQLIIKASDLEEFGIALDEISNYTIDEIKYLRDFIESKRLERIKEIKINQLEFHDELFELFKNFLKELKERTKNKELSEVNTIGTNYILNDLKEYWAFWLNDLIENDSENDICKKENANFEFEKFKMAAIEIGIVKKSVETNLIEINKIMRNPFYAISQAEACLVVQQTNTAHEIVTHALSLTKTYSDYFYSAYYKLFEISIEKGGQLMARFKKALANLIFIEVENDESYKQKGIEWLKKALQALNLEIQYIDENLISELNKGEGDGEIVLNENFKSIIVFAEDSETGSVCDNILLKHIVSRKKCLNLFKAHIESLEKQLNDQVGKNMGMAISTRIPNHFKIEPEYKKNKIITDIELSDLGFVGLETVYCLRKVYDVPSETITGAQIQIGIGLSCLATAATFPPSAFLMVPLAITCISEGIIDIAMDIICRGVEGFNKDAYIKGKLVTYLVSLATLGISALANSTQFLTKAINACRSLAEMLRKCKYLKAVCEKFAKFFEKCAKYFEKLKLVAEFNQLSKVDKLQHLDKLKNAGHFKELVHLGGLKHLEHLKNLQKAGKLVELTKIQHCIQLCGQISVGVAKSVGTSIGMHILTTSILQPFLSEALVLFQPIIKKHVKTTLSTNYELLKKLESNSQNVIENAIKKTKEENGSMTAEVAKSVISSLAKQSKDWRVQLTISLIETGEALYDAIKFAGEFLKSLNKNLVLNETVANKNTDEKLEEIIEEISKILYNKIVSLSGKVIVDCAKIGVCYYKNSKQKLKDKQDKIMVNKMCDELEAEKEEFIRKIKEKRIDRDTLPPGDREDIKNISFKFKQHIIVENENGEIEEFGENFEGFNGKKTVRINYKLPSDGGSKNIGHYYVGDKQILSTGKYNCLYDVLNEEMKVPEADLRFFAKNMRTQPYMFDVAKQLNISESDFQELMNSHLVGGAKKDRRIEIVYGKNDKFNELLKQLDENLNLSEEEKVRLMKQYHENYGGSYGEGDKLFRGRSNLYEINHSPPKSIYKNTPYEGIGIREMPAYLMAYTDHRQYETTGNGIQYRDSEGNIYRYSDQLHKHMSSGDFYGALDLEIHTTMSISYHGRINYKQNLLNLIDYCETKDFSHTNAQFFNKDGEKKLITRTEANSLRSKINSYGL